MKTKVLKSFLILSALFFSAKIFAQKVEQPWSVGVYAGKSSYRGDMSNGGILGLGGILHPSKAFYTLGSASLSRYINQSFDAEFYLSYGEVGYHASDVNSFVGHAFNADLNFHYKLIVKEEAKFLPYISLGVGFNNSKSKISFGYADEEHTRAHTFTNKNNSFVLQGGLGASYKITPSISVRYFATLDYILNDKIEGLGGGRLKDLLLQNNIGVVYNFGSIVIKKDDSDKDGVSDKKDKCPGTIVGALVDKTGCILDKDKDGVADNLDACPDVLGSPIFKGCPDTDADSVQDSEDACPQVAGKVAFKGCPDSDNDGVEDSKDKCPQVAGIAKLDGCPADADGDGVTDADDKCPNVAGVKDNNGCPVEAVAVVNNKTEKPMLGKNGKAVAVNFSVAKSTIKTPTFDYLNYVVTVLNENPTYTLEIDGHADSRGEAKINQVISDQRAEVVKAYLVKKGIAETRIVAKGFGESKPIESNETAAGRAANRRVELKLIY